MTAKYTSRLLTGIFVFFGVLSRSSACDCNSKYTPNDLYKKADFVFVAHARPLLTKAGFTIGVFKTLKSPYKLGSHDFFVSWASELDPSCRPQFIKKEKYIYFLKSLADEKVGLVSECDNDVLAVKDQYYFKNKTYQYFDFYKFFANSVSNGLHFEFATEMDRPRAEILTKRFFENNFEFVTADRSGLTITSELKKDVHGQLFWSVRIQGDFQNKITKKILNSATIEFYSANLKEFKIL